MDLLVTGAPGFVGRHMVRYAAARGARVTGWGRRPDPAGLDADGRAVSYVAVDLTDPRAVREALATARPTHVAHLAAEASVSASWSESEPRRTIVENAELALNLLDAVRHEAPDARILVACSGEEYGPVPAERLPVLESEELRPQNPYAVSKAAVDLVAGFHADAHGLDVIRPRAFNHAGPGQSDAYVAGSFARQIAAAERACAGAVEIATGNVEVRRDFTDVRDVVRAYWLLLEGAPPGAFNVCSGTSTSIAEILDLLAAHTGLRVERRVEAARVRPHEVMEIRGSARKIEDATGWRPELPLERTLADALEDWRGASEDARR